MSNPLSFWINKSNGACQVKDLSDEERDFYVKEFQDKQDRINQQVIEFSFKSRKIVKRLEDMTELEKKQWLIFLKHDNSEILEHTENFFDDEFNDNHGFNEEIYIDTWEWSSACLNGKDQVLTDMYGWPGDNQSGGVFVNEDMIFENSDSRVDYPRINDRYERKKNSKYEILSQRKDALSHLKGQLFSTDLCDDHEHCNLQLSLSEL